MALFYIEIKVLEFYKIEDNDIEAMMKDVKIRKPTYSFQQDMFGDMQFNKI